MVFEKKSLENGLDIILSEYLTDKNENTKCVQIQFVGFEPLSYCFEERIGFDVKTSFERRPLLRLIR